MTDKTEALAKLLNARLAFSEMAEERYDSGRAQAAIDADILTDMAPIIAEAARALKALHSKLHLAQDHTVSGITAPMRVDANALASIFAEVVGDFLGENGASVLSAAVDVELQGG